MPGKHIPQRTCIACRTVRGKREFVRIVRVTAEHLEADARGGKKFSPPNFTDRGKSSRWGTPVRRERVNAQTEAVQTKS